MKKEDKKSKTKKPEDEEEEEEEVEEEVEEEEEEEDIVGEDFAKDPRAFSYLQDAGRIADDVLKFTMEKCKPSANIYEICQESDNLIRQKLSKIYTKKKFIKGTAFPTCISVNEVCGNYSPLVELSEDPHEYKTLSEGDVAKISLGVEINGFAALAGHTVVVSDKKEKIKGNKADVILAAYNSIQAALRMMTKENTNNEITDAISKICNDYKVNPIEGVLSHRMRRDIIDGLETIINKSTVDQKVDERKFEHGDVFGLAVVVSTGEGKPKETTIKTSIYKRALETTYKLRTDSGRKLLSVIDNNFHFFPFSFSAFDKEENIKLKQKIPNFKTTMKMGLSECVKNNLLHGYPVLTEKKGEIVAEFTYTIAVRNEGPIVISGLNLDVNDFETDKKITDEKINKELEKDLDLYLPNYKRTKKEEKKKKKDNKAKRAAKKAAKKKRQEEAKKKREAEGK
jgi:curved DNA binding protein